MIHFSFTMLLSHSWEVHTAQVIKGHEGLGTEVATPRVEFRIKPCMSAWIEILCSLSALEPHGRVEQW